MRTTLTAILDACVLYPAPLRDLLVELAVSDLFRARWTAAIHDEWTRNLRANRPDLNPSHLDRTRELMDSHVRDCLVTGYEALVDGLTLPDPDDRHVLAAAIRCDADLIVTKNLKDFPGSVLHENKGAACTAAKVVRSRLKKPPKTCEEYLLILQQQELPQFVNRLRDLMDLL